MFIEESLFEGERICLAPIDRENDASVESKWAQDGEYLRLLNLEPALPAPAERIKKRYESIEKEVEQDKNLFYFTIRLRTDDRLIGFARIYRIGWAMQYGSAQLGIGDAGERGKGYGSEALELLLRYAFGEINLFRVEASIPEYNPVALHLFRKAGFSEEARLRQALYRNGRRWDTFYLGLLAEEWRDNHG
jgi:RimJ/RimL family protein N-acetyltransferase